MRHFFGRCLLGLGFVGVGLAAGAAEDVPTDADAAEMAERVKAVVLQNKAARAGIDSYSMKITWKRRDFPETPLDAPLPEGTVISYGEGIWMEKGEMYHIHRTKRWERPRPEALRISPPHIAALEGKEYSSWAVYNGEYFANHRSRLQGRIYLFPRDTLENRTGLVNGERFPYPLKWGFGFGSGYLDVEYEKSLDEDETRWEREDIDTPDGPRIKVTRISFSKRRNYDVRTDFLVAPEQGFLLTSVVAWNPPGIKEFQIEITLASLGEGRFYPTHATQRRSDDFHEYTFSEVQLNPDLEDALFTIDAFDLDYGATRIHRRKPGNAESRLLFREGQWIPESLVPKHLRPEFPGDGIRYSGKDLKAGSER